MDIASPERLRKAAEECCQNKNEESSGEDFLQILQNALVVDASSNSKLDWQRSCAIILQEAAILLDPQTSNGKMLWERVEWELPNVLILYARVSKECQILVGYLIRRIAEACDPHEISALLMGALQEHIGELDCCFPPLIQGIVIAYSRIERAFPKCVGAAISVLLAVARTAMEPHEMSLNPEKDIGSNDIEERTHSHAFHLEIQNGLVSFGELLKSRIAIEQVEKQKQLLQQYLGCYILQLLAITEVYIEKNACGTLCHLIRLLDSYASSFHELLTANLHELVGNLDTDDCDTQKELNLLEIEKGIGLTAYWRLCGKGMGETAESLEGLKCISELSKFECLCTLRKAKSLLALSLKGSFWDLARKGIVLIDTSLDLCTGSLDHDEDITIQDAFIRETLDLLIQVQEVIIHTPNQNLGKHGFLTLKKIVAQAVPEKARLESLSALIKCCTHPSLVSLLFNCLKDELAKAWPKESAEKTTSTAINDKSNLEEIAFTSSQPTGENFTSFDCILGLLGSVLKPEGLPEFPGPVAVLDALNLYRFLLIRESTGGSNYTKVMSIPELKRARTEWLLPLRVYLQLLHLRLDEFDDGHWQIMELCMTECVLVRCIELVEELLSR